MATMEREAAVRAAGEDLEKAGSVCGADELKVLLAHLTEQIIDADRRHSEVLRLMHDRLSHLGMETRSVRAQSPEHVEALSRIEGSMASLAERVSEASVRPAHPAALRSATDGHSAGLAPRPASGIDPFEVFDTSRPEPLTDENTESEPWDTAAAEALTRLHESGETGYAVHTPDPEFADDAEPLAPAPAAAREEAPAAAAALASPPFLAEPDKVWLSDQLASLAHRFEQSMGDLNPQGAAQTLSERFNDFEDRLAAAFEALATRSDVEALGLIEAHINELAQHLEAAQSQLARLEAIETQLHTVSEHISDDRMTQGAASPTSLPTGADLQRLVADAAELAATRVHSLVAPATGAELGSEIRAMMSRFMDERRLGDEHMASMLDTMQQALIRVLDRMDAMELAQIRSAAPLSTASEAPAAYLAASYGVTTTAPEERREPPFSQPARPAPAPETEVVLADPMPTAPPTAAVIPAQAPANSVDRIRQDFKAEAQRAKQKAVMEADAAAAIKIDAKSAIRKPAQGAKVAPDTSGTAKAAASSNRRGMLLGALTLVVAITAGALMLPKMKSGSKPAAVTTEQSQKPVGKKSDKTAAPVAAQNGEKPAAAAPGADAGASDVLDLPAETAPQAPSVPETVTDDLSLGEELPEATPKPAAQSNSSMLPLGLELQNPTSAPLASSLLKIDGGNGNQPAATPAAFSMTPGAAPAVTGQQAGMLDLPPATVGPLSLRLAAAKGDPSAEFEVGSRLAEGKGTGQNFKEAHRWYQRSAARGFAQAQYRLGTLFERGLGAQQDLNRARIWYQRAAEQGNVKAMHNLAVLSAGSQSGAPDYDTAAHWFREAALRNLADSQFNMGVLQESGLGVEKNLVEAYKWFTLAAAGGDKEAVRRIDIVRPQLTSEQLAAAQALARDFVALRTDLLANDPRAAGEDWKKRQSAGDNG